jgi:predicted dehydrogenase
MGDLYRLRLNYVGVVHHPGSAGYRPRWRHHLSESGGGVLMDMLHVVYLASWFMGAEPLAVSATVDRRFDDGSDVEDYALVRYDYPRGHAMINMAWGRGPGGYELMGTQGRIIMTTEGDGTIPFVPADRVRVTSSDGTRDLAAEKSYIGGFEGIMSDFRDAATNGSEPIASGAAGAAVLEAVVAAYKSAALGAEVTLPLDPSDPVYQEGAAGIASFAVSERSLVRRRGLFGVPRSEA